MRGEIIYKILYSLGDLMLDQVDFANALLDAGYGASRRKINYEFSKIQNKRISRQIERDKIIKFQKYLSKLKSEGIILENSSKQIYLSEKGKNKLNNLKNYEPNNYLKYLITLKYDKTYMKKIFLLFDKYSFPNEFTISSFYKYRQFY